MKEEGEAGLGDGGHLGDAPVALQARWDRGHRSERGRATGHPPAPGVACTARSRVRPRPLDTEVGHPRWTGRPCRRGAGEDTASAAARLGLLRPCSPAGFGSCERSSRRASPTGPLGAARGGEGGAAMEVLGRLCTEMDLAAASAAAKGTAVAALGSRAGQGGGGAGLVRDRPRAGTEVFVMVAAARLANPGCLACRCNRSGRGCEPLVAGAWGHRKRAARATRAREGAHTTPKDLFEDTYPSFAPTNILFVSRDQKPSCGGDEPGRGCCSGNWSGYWPWRR